MLGFLKRLFAKPLRNVNPILLVIAENKVTQEAIRRDFEALSCKVIPTFLGHSAWQALEIGVLPDVVILDFVLPDDNGPNFFRRFGMDKRFSSIPIIPLPFSLSNELGTGGIQTLGELPTGPTEFNTTPFALLFSVADALRKNNARLPTAFREKIRSLTRLLTDGINPDDPK